MSRLLFLLALAVVGYYLYRRLIARPSGDTQRPPVRELDMVRCDHCGIHLPAAESLTHRGRRYCSREHMETDDAGKH